MNAALPDVNVFFVLLSPRHNHTDAARKWADTRSEPASIQVCRIVQMGVLRLLTMPSVMRDEVRTPAEFWQAWDIALSDNRLSFVEEPAGLTSEWRTLCDSLPEGASGNTDTYLAAFAQAAGLTLATFDRGFSRFPNLSVELLSPS